MEDRDAGDCSHRAKLPGAQGEDQADMDHQHQDGHGPPTPGRPGARFLVPRRIHRLGAVFGWSPGSVASRALVMPASRASRVMRTNWA